MWEPGKIAEGNTRQSPNEVRLCFFFVSRFNHLGSMQPLPMWIATFRLNTVRLFFRRCGHLHTRHLMNRYCLIGWFLKAVIGAFRRCVLSVVYSHKAILWLRFKIVGVRASGIFIPLSLLIFFRWSLSCIANFTWRVQHWVSISIKFTSFQSRHCLQL